MKKKVFLLLIAVSTLLSSSVLRAQSDGLGEGYDGEWNHVSTQLIALAEAIPADKYAWRPGPGVRSVSEVYMHLVYANFYMLSFLGEKMPAGVTHDMGKRVTSKPEVIDWLNRSLDAVKTARAQLKPGELQHKVKLFGIDTTVDGVYLRIIVHNNEHMGQMVAYARMNNIVPPWSLPAPAKK